MTNRCLLYVLALLFTVIHALAGQSIPANIGPWSGVIVNSTCSADEAYAEAVKCTTANVPGAQLALYDDTIRKIYSLDPLVAVSLGDAVIVHGTLVGDTIHGATIKAHLSFGLEVGQKAPVFSARDQFGHEQTLSSLRGSNGTVLLFYRSADWCPFCKGQLIQLQSAKTRFEKQGIKLAAISYDSVEILKYFSDRRKIEFSLLADPDSQIIRSYKVLNSEGVGRDLGMARPGYFFIDTQGVIREKFFEAKYRKRLTGNNVVAKLFPELGEEVSDSVDAPHMQLSAGQSDRAAVPGNLVTLTADVRLPPNVHVYAPGTKGYKPIQLVIDSSPELELRPAIYPRSKILYLPVIKERVPVFEGSFRITQDVTVSSATGFYSSLGESGKTIAITGQLKYQACDERICYSPTSVPVKWELQILPLDLVRAPEAIRHK